MVIQGYVDPNFPNPMEDGDARIVIYGYTPSLVLAIISLVVFVLGLGLHSYQLWRSRKTHLWFSIPFVIGTVMELVGYIARALSNQISPYRVSFFVVNYFFIVVAPVLFSAGLYANLSALIRKVDKGHTTATTGGTLGDPLADPAKETVVTVKRSQTSSPLKIPPKAILWIFITADVICTIIQIVGAALIGTTISNGKDPTFANDILLAGLAIQVLFFLIFLILLAIFVSGNRETLFAKIWSTTSHIEGNQQGEKPHIGSAERATNVFMPVYIVAALAVYLRTVFRLAETAQGLFSYASSHESLFGCFEFAPIVVAVWLMGIWHPRSFV